MLTLHSFLQTIYEFVKSLVVHVTKRMYRHAAVFTSGTAVLMVVALTASGFGGGGRSALTAYAETPAVEEPQEEEAESEELELFTEAKIQASLSEVQSTGQFLIGGKLVEEVLKEQEYQKEEEKRAEQTKEELRRIEEEKARIAAEEEARRLEEEARRREEEERRAAAVVGYSDTDYQVLLRIVQAEAGICDDRGKILVANVILNRVRDSEFPNSITEVVYQPSQFSPVSNGSINTCQVTQKTVECVNRALSGEDYSQGALYFMYRGGSKSHNVRWFDGRLTFLFQHERHEFFK